MAGRTPSEAAQAFLAPLQSALGCIAYAEITPSPGGRNRPNMTHAWTINSGDGVLVAGGSLRLIASMRYQLIEEDTERGPWRATTKGYMYSVETLAGAERVAVHWHPETPGPHKQPHLHLPEAVVTEAGGFLAREPLQTGRFTFEMMIRMLVQNFQVPPLTTDWENRLLLAETPHRLYRSWHQTPAEAAPEA